MIRQVMRDEDGQAVGGPCAVRITHVPTGKTAYADDGDTLSANREHAVARLAVALESGD
ncbi:MAG TPA: hypothetical protein VFH70_00815 [Acidimicrobiales bacterium]|nr:hypothetical protein [Acidimicrobiales bacterium]